MLIERIKSEGLKNTRDIGGFETVNGSRIKHGILIRSGELFNATLADKKLLSEEYRVSEIIDFRTSTEIKQKPDPEITGASYTVIPVLHEETLGITREKTKDGMQQLTEFVYSDGFDAKEYMTSIYKKLVNDEYSRLGYRKFFRILLKPHNGAVLWHCSAGKDRAGVATALLLAALGVSRENIVEDYMKVNDFTADEVEKMINGALKNNGDEVQRTKLRTMFFNDTSYIKSVFDAIENGWGNIQAFLAEEMGLRAERLSELRKLYLE